MTPVAAMTTAVPASRLHGQPNRPSTVSVGTIVWLASELMFFAALFAAYFTIRNVAPDLWASE
ncbi:MAG: heme-copper oxidase subunit III, partial [Nocardioidaceae bacterium]|nr:heme-copper oxidase subunit III [Nocardioidaceae bacterium]